MVKEPFVILCGRATVLQVRQYILPIFGPTLTRPYLVGL